MSSKAVNALVAQLQTEVRQEYRDELLRLNAALEVATATKEAYEAAFLVRIDQLLADLPDEAPYYGGDLRTHWTTIRSLVAKPRTEQRSAL